MELRVHGIGGPDPAGVLGRAGAATVVSWGSEPGARSVVRSLAGDREVFVYHWSPLTSGSRSFAVWPLLLPFTVVNVAGWMAPPGKHRLRRTLHRAAAVWVALATTAATVVWLLIAALAVWREVSGGEVGRTPGGVSGWYFTAVAASAALAVSALVLMATYAAAGFERFRPKTWPKEGRPRKSSLSETGLEDPGFYDNEREHKVRWYVHATVAALTFACVVTAVYLGGTERAGHFLGRALVAVGAAQGLGIALIAVAGVLPDAKDGRRPTKRILGAATATLGVVLLGGLVLSALISFTGIEEVPPGPVAALYDCYGWAVLAALATALLCVVFTMLTAVPAEEPGPRALVPTVGARLRARLATVLSNIDRIVSALAFTFVVAAGVRIWCSWSEIVDDRWRLTATPPVNLARSTFAFVLAFTVLNLVKSRASFKALRRIGNVWDILTFWPRTFHPFAVRPYAERAVPELQEFLLTAPRHGSLVVSAHSQGSVLAYAAIRPLIDRSDCPAFALVTFGSPLQALYGELFPYYFVQEQFKATQALIEGGWVNCFRFTDHVGRAVFASDKHVAKDFTAGIAGPDRPIADARPPDGKVNGHNDYWIDPEIRDVVKAGEEEPVSREAEGVSS